MRTYAVCKVLPARVGVAEGVSIHSYYPIRLGCLCLILRRGM